MKIFVLVQLVLFYDLFGEITMVCPSHFTCRELGYFIDFSCTHKGESQTTEPQNCWRFKCVTMLYAIKSKVASVTFIAIQCRMECVGVRGKLYQNVGDV